MKQVLAAAIAATAVLAASAQTLEPKLRITSPAEATYVTGTVRLTAIVEPSSSAKDVVQLTFFADGTQVCVLSSAPFECEWNGGQRILAHQIRAVAAMRNGQRLVHTLRTRELEYVEAVDVDVVQVTAIVTDQHGRFVSGLTKDKFKIREDGKLQTITSFAAENTPLELVAAIDVSASVNDALPGMKKAAARFLRGLEPRDQATVLGFNDNVFTLVRRSVDPVARERAIGRLASWGGTALYDAIVEALGILGEQAGRRSVVLFTDGDDQSSHATMEAAMAKAEASDAMIYAIGQGRAVHAKELQKLLQRLAGTSGGLALFASDPSKLDEVFTQILDDLHHQYVLSYPAPDDKRDGKWHQLSVEVAGGQYHVRARQGYRLTRTP
jgi:Ca-activated chloride channel homolog